MEFSTLELHSYILSGLFCSGDTNDRMYWPMCKQQIRCMITIIACRHTARAIQY